MVSKIENSLPWDVVEKRVKEETEWLQGAIPTFRGEEKDTPITCKKCLLRYIALMIVSGKVKARELRRKLPLKSFWSTRKRDKKGIIHGQDWHRQTMAQIEDHFINQGYEVMREPNLNWGRADLGAYRKGEQNLLIEIGTTSLFKLWYNLAQSGAFAYLLVPNDDRLVEFRKN